MVFIDIITKMTFLTFILACYGLTMILVYGKIFDAIRPKHHFFKCTMCLGFWSGVFVWMFVPVQFNFLIAGFISSGTSYILSKIVDDDGIAIKNK